VSLLYFQASAAQCMSEYTCAAGLENRAYPPRHSEILKQVLMKKFEETEQVKASSLGQILRERRQSLKMEMQEVSTYLKIRLRDVEAIESDDFGRVTKHLYIPGLVRSFAQFLKIDPKIIEEEIKLLPIKSNVENKKHQLLNIGENTDLTPDKNIFFNFLLISIFLFLVLLSLYNSFENNDGLITNQKLIHELENIGH
jgi:hypothetical protein